MHYEGSGRHIFSDRAHSTDQLNIARIVKIQARSPQLKVFLKGLKIQEFTKAIKTKTRMLAIVVLVTTLIKLSKVFSCTLVSIEPCLCLDIFYSSFVILPFGNRFKQ